VGRNLFDDGGGGSRVKGYILLKKLKRLKKLNRLNMNYLLCYAVMMIKRIRNLLAPKIQSMNWVELDSAALVSNYHYLQSLHPDDVLIPVLKSNAYGHGLREICRILKKVKPDLVAVDSYPEYQIVRDGLSSDILIIGEMDHSAYRQLDPKRAVLAVYRVDTLQHLIGLGKKWRIHLFLNTGMNREGLQQDQLDEFLTLLQWSQIQLEGVMSHLAYGDSDDVSLINPQVERFKTMYDVVLSYGFSPTYRHINNSGGLLSCDDDFWTAHRSGLALYGYNPINPLGSAVSPLSGGTQILQPVMSVWSSVVAIQQVSDGMGVGYDGTWTAWDDEMIATIPFGYMEGLWRAVNNHWKIKHAWGYLDCAGRISMNLSSWVAGDAVQVGDEVCVISDNLWDDNSFVALAEQCGTIVYEVLVRIDRGMRRKII
jgi:alanine racemase